ncbi:MAG: thioredoxin domain-containing protein [Pseudomonadales bacterium]|nr:thioredoxin domain-containing protein [Pseudomonadales bacterium]
MADLPVLGMPDTSVAIIEVTDYRCPFCQEHFRETLPQLRRELIETGQVSYFVQAYPLSAQDGSGLAAAAASCAAAQGRFWEFHQRLLGGYAATDRSGLLELGRSLELDTVQFGSCLGQRGSGTWIQDLRNQAVGLGVRGTPTFFIGRLSDRKVVTEVTVLAGRQSIDSFRQIVAGYLGRH